MGCALRGTSEARWPTHFPASARFAFDRLDYIFVRGCAVQLGSGAVLSEGAPAGDHVPVVATLALAGIGTGLVFHRGFLIWDPAVYYFASIPSQMDWENAWMTCIGAIVGVQRSDGSSERRTICAGSGYLSQSSAAVSFARGPSPITAVLVIWPEGLDSRVTEGLNRPQLVVSHP
jgi:hypothetical protein